MLEKLERRVASMKASSLSPDEVMKWLKVGVEVERLARGEANESTGVQIAAAVQIGWGEHVPAWASSARANNSTDGIQ